MAGANPFDAVLAEIESSTLKALEPLRAKTLAPSKARKDIDAALDALAAMAKKEAAGSRSFLEGAKVTDLLGAFVPAQTKDSVAALRAHMEAAQFYAEHWDRVAALAAELKSALNRAVQADRQATVDAGDAMVDVVRSVRKALPALPPPGSGQWGSGSAGSKA